MEAQERSLLGLYDLLWKSKTQKQEEASRYGDVKVNIPDTVVYMFAKAQNWYFTSSSGETKGRVMKRIHLSSSRILQKMVTKSKCDIAAYSITHEVGNDDINIKYYNINELVDVLQHDGLPDQAILQQFIEPKSSCEGRTHNCLLQSFWQPYHCLIERRESQHALYDKKYTAAQRAETIEGLRHSSVFPLQSPIICDYIKELCNGIAEHIFFVADLVVRKMCLNWKIDSQHQVRLLWCSSFEAIPKGMTATPSRGPAQRIPANARLYLSHQRHLEYLLSRKRKREKELNTIKPFTPVPQDGLKVYAPPSSSIISDENWGSAYPILKKCILKKSTQVPTPVDPRRRRRSRPATS